MTDNKPPLRVAIWCAVSSKPQAAEDKSSLADQEAAGRQFAEAIRGVVVRVYQVPGNTRDIIFWDDAEREMEAYRQLRQDAQDKVFDVLHVIDPDRIGRDPALANQVVSLVDKSGAEVYFASNPHVIGQRSAGQRYVFAIQSTRAQEDQLRRVAYHDRGMRARVKNGLHPGTWPYGYEPIYDGAKVIGARLNAEAAEAIHFITEQFLLGSPYRAITRMLDASPYRLTSGSRWRYTAVRRIVNNDAYAGILVFKGEAYASDRFPAIWDEATYAAIQRERERRRDANGRRVDSPLNRVAYCARCGSTLHRAARRTMACSYHIVTHDCHPNFTKENLIEQALLQFLEGMSEDKLLEQLVESQGESRQTLNAKLKALTGRLDEIEAQRTRLALAFAAGDIEIDIYRVADEKLKETVSYWSAQRNEIEQRLATLPDLAQRRQALRALRVRVHELFTIPALEANTLIREAGVRIYCEDRKVKCVTLECD